MTDIKETKSYLKELIDFMREEGVGVLEKDGLRITLTPKPVKYEAPRPVDPVPQSNEKGFAELSKEQCFDLFNEET